MELDNATVELYRVAPVQFTAARDAMAVEARQAGQLELASSLKKLRKPSVGAWLANLLVLEQSSDVEHLVDLGAELRAPKRKLEGDRIRRVSKEKAEAVSKLVRDARSKASGAGQSVSPAAWQELEATLEAAFADPKAAERLLEGRLSSGLNYSGLGFGEQAVTQAPKGTKGRASERHAPSKTDQVAAERALAAARHEAEQADAEVEEARRAVADADRELTRLKSVEARAVRRSKAAHAKVTSAKKKQRKT
jgi:hypothetical protein